MSKYKNERMSDVKMDTLCKVLETDERVNIHIVACIWQLQCGTSKADQKLSFKFNFTGGTLIMNID